MSRHFPRANPGVSPRQPVIKERAALAAAIGLTGALLSLVLLPSLSAAPRDSDSPPRRDYASFKLITDKNIFNASRSSRSDPRPRTESRRPSRVDTLTLVGTLSYDKGPYAFFDSSRAEYRTVLEPGKTIAGYQIAEITSTGVILKAEDNALELRVGMQLRREEGEGWRVADGETGPATVAGSESQAIETGSTGEAGEESDIIKRMIQQREQELK